MIYFEDARVEFFGVPLAYFPFMSAPDPSVKRKSGFLFPNITYSSNTALASKFPISGRWRRTTDLTASVDGDLESRASCSRETGANA